MRKLLIIHTLRIINARRATIFATIVDDDESRTTFLPFCLDDLVVRLTFLCFPENRKQLTDAAAIRNWGRRDFCNNITVPPLSSQANWYRASQYCRYHGMHLASIASQEENDRLEKHIKDFGLGHEHFWTSGTDQAEEGTFFWMANGRPITFENWNVGEPNNFR